MSSRLRWRSAVACLLTIVLVACSSGRNDSDPNPTLNFFSVPDVTASVAEVVRSCNERGAGRYTIALQQLPFGSDRQREQLARRLSAHDPAIDIIAMDVNWTAEFASAGWVREWEGDRRDAVTAGTLEGPLDTAMYEGNLYGAPFHSNTQLLWYREDLVRAPPTTWDEMIAMASALAAQGKPHLVEVQGAKYEGLTVWFNTLVASGGGHLLDAGNERASVGEHTRRAAEIIKRVSTSVAADPALATQEEDDNRAVFEAGRAAFQVNYPFVFPLARSSAPAIFRNMGWAPYPRVDSGTPAKVTIGGVNLGVGAFSRNPDKSFEAVTCLTSRESGKTLALRGGLPPVAGALYDDPDVRAGYPFADDIREALRSAAVRPKTPQYTALSLAIQNVLSPPSAIDPETINSRLEREINNALGVQP